MDNNNWQNPSGQGQGGLNNPTEPVPPLQEPNQQSAPSMPGTPSVGPDIAETPLSAPLGPGPLPISATPPPGEGDYMNNVLGGGAKGAPAPEQTYPSSAPAAPTPATPDNFAPPPPEGMPEPSGFSSTPSAGGPAMPIPPAEPAKKSSKWLPIVVLIIIAIGAVAYFFIIRKPSATQQTGVLREGSTTVSTGTEAGNDATRKNDLDSLQKALEQYYQTHQAYPVGKEISKTQDSNTPLTALVPDYLAKLPTDPAGGETYYGYKSPDGKTYELSAIFDTAPTGVKSTQIAKGFLVTLTPGTIIESVGSASATSSSTSQ